MTTTHFVYLGAKFIIPTRGSEDSGGKEMDAIRAEINEVVESGRCGCSECPDKEETP